MIGKIYGKSDQMLGHHILHMKHGPLNKIVSKVLKCQVTPKSKNEFKNKKGIVDICVWLLTQGRHEDLKGKSLSPVFIEAPKLRKIFPNSNYSHNCSFSLRNRSLCTYCTSISASLPIYQNTQSCTKMSEKDMSKRTMVSTNSKTDGDIFMYLDPKPLKMIVPVDVSTKESKNATTKKNTSCEKVSSSKGESSLKILVETMITSKTYPSGITLILVKPLIRNKMWDHMLNHLMVNMLN